MPTVRVLTNINKGRITVQPVVPFFDGNNLVTRARIPFTIGAGGETLIAIAPSAVVLYEFRVLDERDVVVWVSRLTVPSSTQIINLRDIASVPLPGEDPAIAIGINLLSEQLLDNAQFLADLEAAIGSGTVDLSNYPTFVQGDARYYQHGETIADIDIPGTIARDSEVTGAIAAHEASRNHPLATTSAAGLLSGADKAKIDGIDAALNAKLNASLLNANNGAAGLNASGKHLQSQALASAVMYTPATGIMAFTWADGSSQSIDLPIENLLQAASYNPGTQTLSVTTAGGTVVPISLATLVDLPEIVIGTSDPAIAPSSGQRLYFRSDTGEYWVSTGSAWSGKYLAFTSAERSKLAGIATGATANATDAALRDRSSHTGAQAIATVTGLQTALDGKAATAHTHVIGDVTGLQTAIDARPTLAIADGRYRLQSVALTDGDIPATIARSNDARFPTAGEKAALAGSGGTPSDANRFVTNSDSRLSDARTPLAHNHPSSQVTGLDAALTKLAGIENNATADQTADEIRDALITLAGINRLPASAIRDLPAGGAGDWATLANRPQRLIDLGSAAAPASTANVQISAAGAIAFAIPQGWNYLQSATAPTTRPDSSALQDNDRWLQPQEGQLREWYRRRGVWTPTLPDIQIFEHCSGPSQSGTNARVNDFQTYGSGTGMVVNTQQANLFTAGAWSVDPGTTVGNVFGLRTAVGNGIRLANYNAYSRCKIALPSLSTAAERFDVVIGFSNSTPLTTTPSTGAYFRYSDDANAGEWECIVAQSGSTATLDTNVAAVAGTFSTASDFFILETLVSGTATQFWINDALVAESSIRPTSPCSFVGAQVRKNSGTLNRGVWICFMQLDVWGRP